ncbi:hypothetical protein TNCV_172921 [Trichonephila clavipes]|nr:hypothetical protein TNCV_172921 [Trichonephila clavipes]
MYEPPIPSVEDLLAPISVAAERIRDMPGIFDNIRNSLQRRCQANHTTSDRNFEHLLQYNLSIKGFCPIKVLLFLFFFSASLRRSSQLQHLRPCIPM